MSHRTSSDPKMTRRLPNSTPSIIRLLRIARDMYKITPNPADRCITPEQFARIDDANPNCDYNIFLREVTDVDLAQAALSPLSTDLSKSAAVLTMFASHFFQVFDLAVLRGVFLPGDRHFYGREATATALPDLSTYDAVEKAAEKIVAGEAAREAAAAPAPPATYDSDQKYDSGITYDSSGSTFVPMAMPSADEVGTLLAQFRLVRTQSKAKQTMTRTERGQVKSLYPAMQELAVDICDTVEFSNRKEKEPSTFRAKCEAWGLVYVGEHPATPPPTPTPTPTSGPSA